MRRVWLILLAGLLVAAGSFAIIKRPDAGDRWTALDQTRLRSLYNRNLVSLQFFLSRYGLQDMPLHTGGYYGGYRENYSYFQLAVVRNNQLAGIGTYTAYFSDFDVEPNAFEVVLTLKPEAVQSAKEGIGELLRRESPEATMRIGETELIVRPAEQGQKQLTIRSASPFRFMPDVPEYDRGNHDEFRYELVPKVLRLLRREVFESEYTPYLLQLPMYNPPAHISHSRTGLLMGYVRSGETLVPLEIFTTSQLSFNPKVTVYISIGSFNGSPSRSKPVAAALDKLLSEKIRKVMASPSGSSASHGTTLNYDREYNQLLISFSADADFEKVRIP